MCIFAKKSSRATRKAGSGLPTVYKCLPGEVLHARHPPLQRNLPRGLRARPTAVSRHLQQHEQPLDRSLVVQHGDGGIQLVRFKRAKLRQHNLRVRLRQQRAVQRDVERRGEAHVLEHVRQRGGPDDQQLPPLWGLALQQDEQRLQHHVAEPRADRDVVQQPLDVVQHDERQRAFVRVLEHLRQRLALAHLRHAHHVIGADQFHKRILRADGQRRRQRRLTTPRRALQHARQHRGLITDPHLLHESSAGVVQLLETFAG
mmetsp:Transcript_974/g.4389  ORF Transcript_974/g.4389 Transcript_974/m.4389 type:complete len:259 (-) Transcript_974:1553-2329(-)